MLANIFMVALDDRAGAHGVYGGSEGKTLLPEQSTSWLS